MLLCNCTPPADYPGTRNGCVYFPRFALRWECILGRLARCRAPVRAGDLWFRPAARYDAIGSEVDFLEPDRDPGVTRISEFVVPKVSGELFFYVNDVVLPASRQYQWFYADNGGCLSLFIKPSK